MSIKSDIELHAYIDGELSADQQAEILDTMQQDPDLAHQVCEINNLKQQLKLAYANPPGLPVDAGTNGGFQYGSLVAGLLLLMVGLFSGWLLHEQLPNDSRLVLLDPDGRGVSPAVAANRETRIVFHLTQPDQEVIGELLDEIEAMLSSYREQRRPLRVEIVSHGEGLGLVRERLSRHKKRIAQLARRYRNLTFVACQNTVRRLRVEQGIEVKLIPEAKPTPSGVTHVVKRQKEGWTYIRV